MQRWCGVGEGSTFALSPVEKDWEDIKRMPEYNTMTRDFNKLRPKYVRGKERGREGGREGPVTQVMDHTSHLPPCSYQGFSLQKYMEKHGIRADTAAFQLVCVPNTFVAMNFFLNKHFGAQAVRAVFCVGTEGRGIQLCGYRRQRDTTVWVQKAEGYNCVGTEGRGIQLCGYRRQRDTTVWVPLRNNLKL